MKIVTQKVYQCEHCKRIMLSAGVMSRHERFCKQKPENKHKCFDECRNLTRQRVLINDKGDPSNAYSYKTLFVCKVTGNKMYSYLLEKNMNFKPEFIDGFIRMPIECKSHQYMNETEWEKRFGNKTDLDY
jgi:hypothetical protein